MKRVLSVSLGSPRRDFRLDFLVAGERIEIERRGFGFNLVAAETCLRAADGEVDAIGLGGVNFAYRLAKRRWPIREAERLRRAVKRTPLVDGSSFKEWVEPLWLTAVERKFGRLKGQTAVLISALDRYPVLDAFRQAGLKTYIGDCYFALGWPILVRDERMFRLLAEVGLPLLRRVPLHRLYPSGKAVERRPWPRHFLRPRLYWGDVHLLLHRLPDLRGAIVVTSTVRPGDVRRLLAEGAEAVVTGPSPVAGLGFGANVWEAVLVARFGRLTGNALRGAWESLAWEPQVLRSIDACQP